MTPKDLNLVSYIKEMIDVCTENSIVGFAELFVYAKDNREDWFRVLCDNATLPMVQFLKSKHWELTKYKNNTEE